MHRLVGRVALHTLDINKELLTHLRSCATFNPGLITSCSGQPISCSGQPISCYRQPVSCRKLHVSCSRSVSSSSAVFAKKPKREKPPAAEAEADEITPSTKAIVRPRRRKFNFMEKYLEKKAPSHHVDVWVGISINQLAEKSGRSTDDILEVIFSLSNDITMHIKSERHPINDKRVLNFLASKLNYKSNYIANPNNQKAPAVVLNKDAEKRPPPDPAKSVSRPPVVTIMGHIDHGKTSLLDYLRKSRIVEGEHGRITQHIGAFSVNLESGETVTFIDTPGHAAFTGMRSRGANVTDMVILIVDACEGILEQTQESLRIIRQSRVPFIVALNKIDKPGADVTRVKQQLAEEGVRLEENGGDVQCVPISALKGTNVTKLIEEVLTLAEMLELTCDPTGPPEGTVIESQVEQGLGRTATILLHRGTLKTAQYIVGGKAWCKVRLLLDDRGDRLKEISPSQAAKVVGWREQVPSAGAEILGVESEQRAKEVVAWRRAQELKMSGELQMESIDEKRKMEKEKYEEFRRKKLESGWFKPRFNPDWNPRPKETEEESGHPRVSVIIKGDVDGSVEAILGCLDTYTSSSVELDVVSFGVGQVNESDLVMAEKFGAIIYAFNTAVPPALEKTAASSNICIRSFNVIYHLIGDLKTEISDRLPPVDVEDVVGRGTVLQEFLVSADKKKVPVAGTRVTQGKIARSTRVRVLRDGKAIYEGDLVSLKHLKDEVSEVKAGQECGLRVEDEMLNFFPGDQVLSFSVRQERKKTDWNPGF